MKTLPSRATRATMEEAGQPTSPRPTVQVRICQVLHKYAIKTFQSMKNDPCIYTGFHQLYYFLFKPLCIYDISTFVDILGNDLNTEISRVVTTLDNVIEDQPMRAGQEGTEEGNNTEVALCDIEDNDSVEELALQVRTTRGVGTSTGCGILGQFFLVITENQ